MPSHFTGTKEDRFRRLESRGQRCDGAARNCTQTAVELYLVVPVDPATSEPKADAEPVERRACSKHRRSIADTEWWRVVSHKPIPKRDVPREERRRGTARQVAMRSLIGRSFLVHAGDEPRRIERVKYDVDDVRITTTEGDSWLLRDIYEVLPSTGTQPGTHEDADAEQDRQISVPFAVRFSG